MKRGIMGVRSMSIKHELNEPVIFDVEFIAKPGYDPHHFINEDWANLFPGDVIVKCRHCQQWGARKAACKYCGAPID